MIDQSVTAPLFSHFPLFWSPQVNSLSLLLLLFKNLQPNSKLLCRAASSVVPMWLSFYTLCYTQKCAIMVCPLEGTWEAPQWVVVSFSCLHHRPNPVLCGLQSSSCLTLDINTQHKTASDRHSHHGDMSLTVREQLWLSHLLTDWLMGQSSAPQQTIKLLQKCQSKQTGTCGAPFCIALRTLSTTSLFVFFFLN